MKRERTEEGAEEAKEIKKTMERKRVLSVSLECSCML